MKVYAVGLLDITDPRWVTDYVTQVTPMVERHGGRYLARTSRAERLEGEGAPPQIFVVVEFPSREAADAFYASEEYRPFRQSRIDGTHGEFFLVPGEDVARR
jgi:uncharacterized protein (DUF1330 family)